MPATQRITAAITISGQQHIAISSHDRGSGSYISVVTGLVMVTMFDLAAARTYTSAWLAPHMLDFAALLPSDGSTNWHNQRDAASIRPVTAVDGPALSIQAHGSDKVDRNFDRNQQVMLVKIGGLLWTVADVEAYLSMTKAYARVANPIDLGEALRTELTVHGGERPISYSITRDGDPQHDSWIDVSQSANDAEEFIQASVQRLVDAMIIKAAYDEYADRRLRS